MVMRIKAVDRRKYLETVVFPKMLNNCPSLTEEEHLSELIRLFNQTEESNILISCLLHISFENIAGNGNSGFMRNFVKRTLNNYNKTIKNYQQAKQLLEEIGDIDETITRHYDSLVLMEKEISELKNMLSNTIKPSVKGRRKKAEKLIWFLKTFAEIYQELSGKPFTSDYYKSPQTKKVVPLTDGQDFLYPLYEYLTETHKNPICFYTISRQIKNELT